MNQYKIVVFAFALLVSAHAMYAMDDRINYKIETYENGGLVAITYNVPLPTGMRLIARHYGLTGLETSGHETTKGLYVPRRSKQLIKKDNNRAAALYNFAVARNEAQLITE